MPDGLIILRVNRASILLFLAVHLLYIGQKLGSPAILLRDLPGQGDWAGGKAAVLA